MLYWRRSLAVVRGCQAPKRISGKPGGTRKRARLGYTERSCTSGLYSGSELLPILRRVRHVDGGDELCRRRHPSDYRNLAIKAKPLML
jgi:hypothetical protein